MEVNQGIFIRGDGKADKYLRLNVSNMRMGNRKIQWGDNVGNGNGDFF